MNKHDWDYFGREGPDGEVYEVYRCPVAVRDPVERFKAMERMGRDLEWRSASDDTALSSEWASGWFSFDDNLLREEQVNTLLRDWIGTGDWPGRD